MFCKVFGVIWGLEMINVPKPFSLLWSAAQVIRHWLLMDCLVHTRHHFKASY